MTENEITKVRIFAFDREIIAACAKEDAVALFQRDTGFSIEDCQPEKELLLDNAVLVEAEDGGTQQFCPRCGSRWNKTTYRKLLEGIEYGELPCYIGEWD